VTAPSNGKLIVDKLNSIQTKYKDALRETLQENFRKGGFLRIYPSKNSHVYDKYFGNNSQTKIGNKYLHGLLFSEDIVPY